MSRIEFLRDAGVVDITNEDGFVNIMSFGSFDDMSLDKSEMLQLIAELQELTDQLKD